jgi:hypothetical protein
MVQLALPPLRVTVFPPVHAGVVPFEAFRTKAAIPPGVPDPGAVGATFAVIT